MLQMVHDAFSPWLRHWTPPHRHRRGDSDQPSVPDLMAEYTW